MFPWIELMIKLIFKGWTIFIILFFVSTIQQTTENNRIEEHAEGKIVEKDDFHKCEHFS